MTDASELYQSLILDHNRAPRNFRAMEQPDRSAEGYNPLCGDQLKVWLKLDGDRIADVSFQGSGCAISKASASLMTTAVKGKTLAEAGKMFDSFHRMVTGAGGPADDLPSKLAVFAGVREFPARVKCASLAWHALSTAMQTPATAPPGATGS
ncbi:MAG: SUF system NifU family Fe-S cluster assembly protein [Gemmatimonadota bacterium]|nr:SUF system NifU family Fe-S cluster assembly protein [Gemmatimonadota bacterium]